MEFSELFVFASFGKVQLSKFGNFSEKTGIFEQTFKMVESFCIKKLLGNLCMYYPVNFNWIERMVYFMVGYHLAYFETVCHKKNDLAILAIFECWRRYNILKPVLVKSKQSL